MHIPAHPYAWKLALIPLPATFAGSITASIVDAVKEAALHGIAPYDYDTFLRTHPVYAGMYWAAILLTATGLALIITTAVRRSNSPSLSRNRLPLP